MSDPVYPHAKNEYEFMPDGSVRITLTRGYFAYVDAPDFAIVAPYRWNTSIRHGRITARNGCNTGGRIITTYMHKLLMPDGEPDHIDCDGLNNRRSNLRYTNRQEGQRNRRKCAPATSRYKGVWSDRRRPGVWYASIHVDRKRIGLGTYESEPDAARSYDDAARELFGEHARLNFPNRGEQSALE